MPLHPAGPFGGFTREGALAAMALLAVQCYIGQASLWAFGAEGVVDQPADLLGVGEVRETTREAMLCWNSKLSE